ncbi:radical SAM protein [Chitinophaga lutea]|uniref:Radical SAM protein n=1 Tax=Chitinophaga lutea TaxID=2488634 RepID=A0A3N4Q9I0_9BACT|nr:radical SAM protein [Chitinophaga lutea]RPE12650.1 radical SAM protein [Chitinophaga lutea]
MYVNIRRNLKQWFYHTPLVWKMIETMQGLAYAADYYYYYKLPGHRGRLSLREINIEFASQCNLRCKFCSLDHFKPKETISKETLERFLDQLIRDDRFRKTEVINLHNGGEILLHPKRVEMLEVIKKYKTEAARLGKRFPQVRMLTNAMLLRESLSQQIIHLDVIDVVGVSFDGGTPELFEEMRTNAVWSKFHENVRAFHQIVKTTGSKTKIYAISCIPHDKPLHIRWMHPEFRELYRLLDWYELRRLHNWAGEVDVSAREKKHKIGCSMLMKQLVLLPNGDITVCCSDLNSKGVIGNIWQKDVVDIYQGRERTQYLELLLKGRKQELALCAGCETF